MKPNKITAKIEALKEELDRVRKDCLQASREGDYRRAAKLTAQARDLNRELLETQGLYFQGVS